MDNENQGKWAEFDRTLAELESQLGDVSLCPACGDVIDYCQGHGEIGDPHGYETLQMHDAGDHFRCRSMDCIIDYLGL